MTVKWIKTRFILSIGMVLIAFAVAIIGTTKVEDRDVEYTYEDSDEVVLTYHDKSYYLGDEPLERASRPFSQVMIELLPFWPYVGGCAAILVLERYLRAKMGGLPPSYRIMQEFGLTPRVKIARIDIPEAPGGLIAVRNWGMARDGHLRSTTVNTIWEADDMEADNLPVVRGWHGVYAHRLGSPECVKGGGVKGVVVLTGKLVGHGDYRVRAERCEILTLLTNREKNIEKLKQHYKCPVLLTSDVNRSIADWTMSSQGAFWLTYNDKMIKLKKKEKFEQDIESIPALELFSGGEE